MQHIAYLSSTKSNLYKGDYPLSEAIVKKSLHLILYFVHQISIKPLVEYNRLQKIKKTSESPFKSQILEYSSDERERYTTRNRMYREVIRSLLSMYQRPAASLYISSGSRPYRTHYKITTRNA